MSRHLRVALMIALLGASVVGQGCPGSQTFLQNDILPVTPAGLSTMSVIQGLCDGEAAGAVMNVASVGNAVKVNMAAVAYGGTANGVLATSNLRIYDGVSFSTGVPVLGPLVFDFAAATGANIQLTSTNINTQDVSLNNVVVNSGTLVVTWWMTFNGDPAGSCATGYPHNFMTDNTLPFQLTCSPSVTPPQKNLIYLAGQGWRDASTATVGGVPLCPLFYAGNWIIRACVEPAPTGNPNTVSFNPNPVASGGTSAVTFTAPGQAGNQYVAFPTFTTTPGLPLPGLGTLPLNLADPLFNLYLTDPFVSGLFLNFVGVIGPGDTALGLVNTVPGVPVQFWVGFVVLGPGGIVAFSDAAQLVVN